MKILLVFMFAFFTGCTGTYKTCASWDTFCKNPAQIVATKCRLGVPVYHEQCKALGQSNRDTYVDAPLQEGLPVSSQATGKDTITLLREGGWIN